MESIEMWTIISTLSELRNKYSLFDEKEYKYYHALSEAIKAVKKQEQDRWIPVTETQPKKSGDYFVTIEYCGKKYVDICSFIVCGSNDSFWTYQNVIAWKPLPEPYQEENDETE